MELKHKLEKIFNNDYPGTERFIADVIVPIFGNEIEYINDDIAEREKYAEKAKNAGIKHIKYIGDLTEKNYSAENIVLLDVTLDDTKNIERSRVNIQQLIRSIMDRHQHLMIVFHYEDVTNKQWRFSYAHKGDSLKDSTSAKRYTYVFGRGYRGRTAAERFEVLAKSPRNDEDFEKAFSVAALSDEFFDKYRDIYADFVQYITGKRYEKIKNKWEEVKKEEPNTEIFSQFNNDDKRVRDYIKKMMGRLTFLCFLQRKGWMNNDRNFLQNQYQASPLQSDFLEAVLEPLFFGVLNTPPEKRKDVFAKNGWNTDLVAEWSEIPYLNGGLFEQTREDKLTVNFPKELFQDLFKFLGEYNFTIDENDPDDAEIGIDPEMLGRVFESLLEDNKDKGAFYTPKEIVQYMCRQSIIEYLKTHTAQSLHADIEDLINTGLVNHALQSKDNARALYKLLKEVTVCDPAIGSGAFPMGILNILFTARQHLYGFLKESEPFNPLEVKKDIIRDNIYGVDIEQGAVDIARLRFWLAILVEEQVATPLPNLDYRIVRGNSLITTFNDEYIQLPENPDGRTKLAKLKKELHQLQNDLFDLNGDKKLQREIEIKCKILDILKVQLGIDKANAQAESRIESDIFEDKKLSGKALKKAKQARAIEEVKSKSLFALNNLITSLTTPATPLADRAQIDIKFFDWGIVFSNIFNYDKENKGFDIIIGNPPYLKERDNKKIFEPVNNTPFGKLYHSGKMDYWFYFMHKAFEISKKGGIVCFITSRYWINSKGAKKMIDQIEKESSIINILDIGSLKVFDNVVGHHMITEIINGIKDRSCLYLSIDEKVENIINKSFSHNKIIPQENLIKNSEIRITNSKFKIISNKTLEAYCDVSQGVVEASDRISNRMYSKNPLPNFNVGDGIFVLSASEIENLKLSEVEFASLKPYLSEGCISRYIISPSNYKLIYSDKDLRQNIEVNPSYLRIKSHLDKFQPYITSSNKPYGLHRPRKKSSFTSVKIIGPSMFKRPTFAIDENQIFTGMSFNIVVPFDKNDAYWIVGLLNSKFAEIWFNNNAKHRGVGNDVGVEKLRTFPMPDTNPILLNIIKANVKKIMSRGQSYYETENIIDHIVYHLYNLTYDEVLIIDPQTPISREEYESFKIENINN